MGIAIIHPLGWLVIGAAGFVAYKAGKKSGLKSDDIDQPGIGDRAVKGAMKTVYKAQKSVSESFGKTKEKYGHMWEEAKTEEE